MNELTRGRAFFEGARDTIPMIVGAIPFGILFGALAVTSGLSPAAALGMSLLVFAGSAQFVAAGLLGQGVGVALIVLTTFIVNLRHTFYAATLGPHLRGLSQRWLAPLAFWLTDETFAVAIHRYQQQPGMAHRQWYYLGSALAMYGNWQLCTLIGIIAGSQLAGLADWGLEFAMIATFIGIIVPRIISRPMLACALAAGAVAVLARDLPYQLGLMAGSLAGIAAGVLSEQFRVGETAAKEGAT